jgi:hypothetical protein
MRFGSVWLGGILAASLALLAARKFEPNTCYSVVDTSADNAMT